MCVKNGGIYMHNNTNLSIEEKIILDTYKDMQEAMINKDIDALNRIIKDETTFTHMSGKNQSKAEYLEDIRSGALDYKAYKIENPEVIIEGNKAILKTRVTLTANAYGAEGSWPFNIDAHFEKVDGKWLYTNK